MTTVMTKQEWLAEGERLFGTDPMQWAFVCPGCGHVQKVEDFKPFKAQGATPESAYSECIGRYTGGKPWANTKPSALKGGTCDYAAYGLLFIGPTIVKDGTKLIKCFGFAGEMPK